MILHDKMFRFRRVVMTVSCVTMKKRNTKKKKTMMFTKPRV